MTYKDIILKHLQENDGITSMEAFKLYGNTRLSATIYCLRHDGHNIVATNKEVQNRYGKKTIVSQYSLVK